MSPARDSSRHSGDVPGIAGIVTVVKEGYPDEPALDPKHHHYDADSRATDPRWYVIDVKLTRKFANVITLDTLKKHAGKALADMILLRRGNRLSVIPVSKKEWDFILELE